MITRQVFLSFFLTAPGRWVQTKTKKFLYLGLHTSPVTQKRYAAFKEAHAPADDTFWISLDNVGDGDPLVLMGEEVECVGAVFPLAAALLKAKAGDRFLAALPPTPTGVEGFTTSEVAEMEVVEVDDAIPRTVTLLQVQGPSIPVTVDGEGMPFDPFSVTVDLEGKPWDLSPPIARLLSKVDD